MSTPLRTRARERRVAPPQDGEWYVTQPPVTQALLDRERFPGRVWEPACGNGAMSRVIEAAGYEVVSSDLTWRGYGEPGRDFLQATELPEGVETVITNPPFSRATQFALHALELGARKVAMLNRLAFLEGQVRGQTLFADGRLSRVWVFSSRQTLWRGDLGGAPPPGAGRGAMAYAWFVWQRDVPGTRVGWIR